MFVLVFEGTFDVFGPFASLEEAEAHLTQAGFIEASVSQHYWTVGDCWCFIKEVQPPKVIPAETDQKQSRTRVHSSGRMMCLDGKTACDPNDKPAGYCEFCGG